MALDKAEVVMVLGGKPYTFMWGTRAIREMQEHLSTPEHLVSPEEIFAELKRKRLKYLCAFIWSGLLKHHPHTKVEDADDILDSATEEEIATLLREFGLSLTPDQKDAKELTAGVKRNPPKARAKRGTGGNSTTRRAALV